MNTLVYSLVLAAATVVSAAQWGLGIVADGRRAGEEGVLVLAVSPDSPAERMDVRVGDRLIAINGQPLAGVRSPNALIQEVAAGSGGDVRLELERDGRRMTLSGPASGGEAAPAPPEGCGYVSTLGVPPRVSRNIYQAEITQINGRSTPLQPVNRHRLPAGRHVLVVREFIDDMRVSDVQMHRIRQMKRREAAGAYKTLVVDVEPGTRYSVGAQLFEDRLDPESIRDNAYWEPVVWESRPERCR